MRRLNYLFVVIIIACAFLIGKESPTYAAGNDNNVEWNGLFADQGPIYMQPQEPAATDPVILKVRTFKGDITSANIKYYDTADSAFHQVAMSWVSNDATAKFDYWQGTIPASASIKYYRYQLNDGTATAWLNAQGIYAATSEPSSGDFWIVPGFHTPTWSKNAIYYQIFPDRFNDGNTGNDLTFKSSGYVAPTNGTCPAGSYVYNGACAYQHNSWSELPETPPSNEDFFGGDLSGITAKIASYLKGTLGVTALYLNPIFQSPSNHKYDTQDYTLVDPHFGTNSDLQTLISTAHGGSYRMSVILDGVFNHTSTYSPWFDQQHLYSTNGAAESQSSQWSDRYVFLNWPGTYCDWAGYSSLPKLNYSSSSLRDDLYRGANSVMQTYLKAPYSADGWRFDAAEQISSITDTSGGAGACTGSDNHQIWQDIRQYVKGVNPEALMLGEYWFLANPWFNGKEWDAAMNYNGFNTPVSEWITCLGVQTTNTGCLSVSQFDVALHSNLANDPHSAQLSMLNSLSTHDTSRFLFRAGGDTGKLSLGIILQMTFVGAPSIYYGDEIGMTGANDPDNRRTFDWNQADWNLNIQGLYQTLIQARRQHSALNDGSFKTLLVDDTNKLYAYGRWDQSDSVITVLNNDTVGHATTIDASQLSVPDGTLLTDILSHTTYTVSGGLVTIPASILQAHSGVVLTVATNTPTVTPTATNTSAGPTNTPTRTPSATPTTVQQLTVAINAGGTASGSYVADMDFDSGNQFSDTSTAISTSAGLDTNPAPQAVYQTVRWNTAFTYTIPGLTAGASYTVRLHWAELTWQAAGQRKFNVAINGAMVLSAFDVFATAGYKQALSRSFTTTANSSGQIAIAFTQGGADNPFISGIEIVSPTGPTNTPTNTPTFVPIINTSSPTTTPTTTTLPDLTITSLSYAPSVIACQNQPGTNVTVANIGNANAGAFVVALNGSTQNVSSLAAGQSTTLRFNITPGNVTATADSTNVITESNENNNTLTATLPIPTPAPTCTPTSSDGAPFSGTPYAIPGKVEAENFNTGGEGVAYHDSDAANNGGQYRTTEGVDIENTTDAGGGFDVGWTVSGEWMKYTVNVASSGKYNFDFREASNITGGLFHMEVDNTNVTGSLTAPNTGGWQTWTDVMANNISLTAGQHIFKLFTDAGGGNYNWFNVTAVSGPTVTSSPTNTLTPTNTPTPTTQCSQVTVSVNPVVSPTTSTTQTINASATGGLGGPYQFTVSQRDSSGNLVNTYNYTSPATLTATAAITINLISGSNVLAVGVNVEVGCTGPNGPFTTFVNAGTSTATDGSALVIQVNNAPTNTPTKTNTPIPTATTGADGSPFNGTPAAIPGTVQVENFNTGGEGIAYHDADTANQGGQYRTTEGVDIETTSDTGGGFNVGWTNSGEWMKYTVNVASSGSYTVGFRVASPNTGTTFHLEVDGSNVSGTVTVPNTGGWQTWTTTNVTVSLTSGTHVLRLVTDAGGMNYNWMSFSTGSATATPTPGQQLVVAIDAGGAANGSYIADVDFDSGNQFSDTSTAISTSAGLDTNPAPQGVYQTVRWNAAFTYTIPNLTAGASYIVRLHWAELTWQSAGSRKFNVAINGTSVLSAFDVFATSGYKQALSRTFTTTANSSGQIVIAFTQGGADNPFISGIEILH